MSQDRSFGIIYGGRVMEKEIVEKLSKKYNRKQEVIIIMLEQCIKLGFDKYYSKNIIEEFYKNY